MTLRNSFLYSSMLSLALVGPLAFASSAQAAPAFVNGGFEAGASSGWVLMDATNTPGWTILYGAGAIFPRLNLNQAAGGPYGNNNEGNQFATWVESRMEAHPHSSKRYRALPRGKLTL